uniref:Lipocalin n=1 Tax=Rhipicephalus zambeziensis TaxID=60191 RepID=A0A224YCK4_9ACAR
MKLNTNTFVRKQLVRRTQNHKQGGWKVPEKNLLINPHPIIISRGIYERHDYPLCVQSRLKRILEVGFNHNLSYYERGYKKQTRGSRWFWKCSLLTLETITRKTT